MLMATLGFPRIICIAAASLARFTRGNIEVHSQVHQGRESILGQVLKEPEAPRISVSDEESIGGVKNKRGFGVNGTTR